MTPEAFLSSDIQTVLNHIFFLPVFHLAQKISLQSFGASATAAPQVSFVEPPGGSQDSQDWGTTQLHRSQQEMRLQKLLLEMASLKLQKFTMGASPHQPPNSDQLILEQWYFSSRAWPLRQDDQYPLPQISLTDAGMDSHGQLSS